MFEQSIRQLKSQDALDRRQAIVKITNSGHADALAVLEQALRGEKDGEIRALTEKAIQYLKTNKPTASKSGSISISQQMKSVTPSNEKSSSGIFVTDNRAALTGQNAAPLASLLPPKPITEQQKKLAKGKLDTAMQFQMSGKTDQALLTLKRALELNPDLERDSFTYGLASALTGGGGDPIAMVKQSSKPDDKEAKKIVVQGATTVLDFGIEMAIITIIFIAYCALAYSKFLEIAKVVAQYAETNGVSSASLSALDLFSGSTRQALLVSALTQGAGLTLSGLVQAFLMFVTGILIGGTGNLLDFLRTIMRVTAGIYLAFGAVFLIFPANSWLPYDPLTRQSSPFSPVILLMVIGLVGSVLWVFFAGRAHGFGFFKGCAMIALSFIGFGVLIFIVLMLAGPHTPTELPSMIMPLLSLR